PTAGSFPRGIAAGPDGNLWFAEGAANQIGRITPDGVITEFPIPTASSVPIGITAGPDGALWFTEPGSNQIGRITVPPASDILTAANVAVIGIPSGLGAAGLYPSPIDINDATAGVSLARLPSRSPVTNSVVVTGSPGRIRKLTVTLRNLSHAYAADLDMLLVGPGGQAALL